MAMIRFKGFRGQVPRLGERLQMPNFAKSAKNIKITSGNIVPLNGLKLAQTTVADVIRTIWRYRRVANGRSYQHWLTFPDRVDVVGSLIASDASGRVYWTSDGAEPRMTTYTDAITGSGLYPAGFYRLGIPSPTVAPSVAATGGVGSAVTRSYAFTFVSALGEESGPSPASALVTGKVDDTWTISAMQTAPTNGAAVSGWANLPGGELVRIGVTSALWVEVGHTITISGVTQASVPGFGRDLNGTHRVVAVNKATNEVDVALPAQNTGSGGAWVFAAPINITSMKKRIYRTDGTAGLFLFLAEVAVATTSYTDTTVINLGEQLRTLNTLPPPGNLTCLTSLPNGCLVGLAENEVCFSDPYMPYSWPVGNRYSFVGRGLALCPVGTSVIVLTDGFPIMLSGTDPEIMSLSVIETYAPCVSKRGAVNIGGGVLYPSHNGLWLATAAGVELRTASLYRADEWSELAPETFEAAYFDGQYYAVHQAVGQAERKILVLDTSELDSAVEVSDYADHLYRNDQDGKMYAAKGGRIYQWDADSAKRYLSEWTSILVQLDKPRNFSHAQVHAAWEDPNPENTRTQEQNAALMAAGADAVGGHILSGGFLDFEFNGSNLRRFTLPGKVQFVLYDGDTPVFAKTVESSAPFRLPSGAKYETVRVGGNANVPIFTMSIAETTEELAQATT
jgi:hypothetical protein